MTTTTQPCFGCLKEMLQAGIVEVRYLHPWDPMEAYDDRALVQQYAALRARFDAFAQVGDPTMDTPELFGAFLERSADQTPVWVDELHTFALDRGCDVAHPGQRVDLR